MAGTFGWEQVNDRTLIRRVIPHVIAVIRIPAKTSNGRYLYIVNNTDTKEKLEGWGHNLKDAKEKAHRAARQLMGEEQTQETIERRVPRKSNNKNKIAK